MTSNDLAQVRSTLFQTIGKLKALHIVATQQKFSEAFLSEAWEEVGRLTVWADNAFGSKPMRSPPQHMLQTIQVSLNDLQTFLDNGIKTFCGKLDLDQLNLEQDEDDQSSAASVPQDLPTEVLQDISEVISDLHRLNKIIASYRKSIHEERIIAGNSQTIIQPIENGTTSATANGRPEASVTLAVGADDQQGSAKRSGSGNRELPDEVIKSSSSDSLSSRPGRLRLQNTNAKTKSLKRDRQSKIHDSVPNTEVEVTGLDEDPNLDLQPSVFGVSETRDTNEITTARTEILLKSARDSDKDGTNNGMSEHEHSEEDTRKGKRNSTNSALASNLDEAGTFTETGEIIKANGEDDILDSSWETASSVSRTHTSSVSEERPARVFHKPQPDDQHESRDENNFVSPVEDTVSNDPDRLALAVIKAPAKHSGKLSKGKRPVLRLVPTIINVPDKRSNEQRHMATSRLIRWFNGACRQRDGTNIEATRVAEGTQNVDHLRSVFDSLDRDDAGKLSQICIQRTLMNPDFSPFQEYTTTALLQTLDTSGSGYLNFDNFCGLWGFVTAWRSLFDRCDEGRKGFLSIDDYILAMKELEVKLLSSRILRGYYRSFAKGNDTMAFDIFIQSSLSLKSKVDRFKTYNSDDDGFAGMSFEDWFGDIMQFSGDSAFIREPIKRVKNVDKESRRESFERMRPELDSAEHTNAHLFPRFEEDEGRPTDRDRDTSGHFAPTPMKFNSSYQERRRFRFTDHEYELEQRFRRIAELEREEENLRQKKTLKEEARLEIAKREAEAIDRKKIEEELKAKAIADYIRKEKEDKEKRTKETKELEMLYRERITKRLRDFGFSNAQVEKIVDGGDEKPSVQPQVTFEMIDDRSSRKQRGPTGYYNSDDDRDITIEPSRVPLHARPPPLPPRPLPPYYEQNPRTELRLERLTRLARKAANKTLDAQLKEDTILSAVRNERLKAGMETGETIRDIRPGRWSKESEGSTWTGPTYIAGRDEPYYDNPSRHRHSEERNWIKGPRDLRNAEVDGKARMTGRANARVTTSWDERQESVEREGEKVEVRNDRPVRISSYERERDYRDRAYGRDPRDIPKRLYDKPQQSKGNDEEDVYDAISSGRRKRIKEYDKVYDDYRVNPRSRSYREEDLTIRRAPEREGPDWKDSIPRLRDRSWEREQRPRTQEVMRLNPYY